MTFEHRSSSYPGSPVKQHPETASPSYHLVAHVSPKPKVTFGEHHDSPHHGLLIRLLQISDSSAED